PGEVGIALRRYAVLPSHVVVFAKPVGIVKRWIREHVVGTQIWMEIATERVGVLWSQVCFDTAQSQIHQSQSARRGIAFLSIDADVTNLSAVGFDELLGLDEHAARTATRVVNPPLVWRKHLD